MTALLSSLVSQTHNYIYLDYVHICISLSTLCSLHLFVCGRDLKDFWANHCRSITSYVFLYNLGTTGINWMSEDCGGNMYALNAGKKVREFMFHPTQRDWALAASWTSCAELSTEF